MYKTVSFSLNKSGNLFNRAMFIVDHILMAHARVTIRNADLPYFGL